MDAVEVRPNDWLWDENYPIRVVFDDGEYSIIWGKYRGMPALGCRWNGGTERGYPGQGGHPTWYVEPDFLAISILNRLFTSAVDSNDQTYLGNIAFALNELSLKLTASKGKRNE